ncbi:MAG: hypothetical protein ACK44E_06915, partial [Anaerolineales bacterium]
MSQSKPVLPPSLSTRLNHPAVIAPLYGALSLGCVLLLGKIVLWRTLSTASYLNLTRPQRSDLVLFCSEFLLVGVLAFSLYHSLQASHVSTKNSLRGGVLGAWLF